MFELSILCLINWQNICPDKKKNICIYSIFMLIVISCLLPIESVSMLKCILKMFDYENTAVSHTIENESQCFSLSCIW